MNTWNVLDDDGHVTGFHYDPEVKARFIYPVTESLLYLEEDFQPFFKPYTPGLYNLTNGRKRLAFGRSYWVLRENGFHPSPTIYSENQIQEPLYNDLGQCLISSVQIASMKELFNLHPTQPLRAAELACAWSRYLVDHRNPFFRGRLTLWPYIAHVFQLNDSNSATEQRIWIEERLEAILTPLTQQINRDTRNYLWNRVDAQYKAGVIEFTIMDDERVIDWMQKHGNTYYA